MIGRTISHYRIEEKLGEGGMGVVYKAEDTRLHRTVALKFIRPDAVENPELKARFLNEAEAAAALIHPNIAVVHEIDEVDGDSFIAMEFVDGESLAEKIKKRPLPLDEALDIATQIAEGLQAAHEKGIVHRDIKPSNIMIDASARAKVMDFGLAQLEEATRITQTGTSVGTPAYMSPEQVRGEKAGHRTDIWSLGVVLYEMVTGEVPFKGDVQEAAAHSVIYEEPEPPTALRSGVPIELDRIIGKALAKKPEERYQHADEMLVDLRQCRRLAGLGESAAKAVPPSVKAGGRWRYVWLAAIVAFLISTAIWRFAPSKTGPGPGEVSIAVLPLRLVSAEAPREEVLSFGLTEQLITVLAQISSLNVIAHTSVLRFKETEQAIPEIGRMLNVSHVIEGSVVRIGDQVRVTAQLIETATDHHVWAGTYQHRLEDILSLQDEVAQAIAREVHVSLTPEESQRFQRVRKVNPRAYEAYLQGLFLRHQLSAESLGKAIEQFKLAIEEDPEYALAYAGLADAYLWAAFYGFESGKRLIPVALEAAVRAVELDGKLAEAHAALGFSQAVSWNWPQAERSFDRAFELNPGVADIHAVFASYWLWPQARIDDALREAERAVQLDPLSVFSRIVLANIGFLIGHRAESIEMLEAVAEHSTSPLVYLSLAPKYAIIGRCGDAMEAMEKARASGSMCVPCRALELALCGREAEARGLLAEAEQIVSAPPPFPGGIEEWPALHCCTWPSGSPSGVALAYAALGEADKTFEWLERAYEERDIFLIWIKMAPPYGPLRSDPRYADLLRRMNLEP